RTPSRSRATSSSIGSRPHLESSCPQPWCSTATSRCERPSKGRNGHYAYYHCQRQCRAVNVSKAALEGAFADELALLQPTPGYMRLVKDRILHVWEQRRAEANDRTVAQQRRVSAIQQKLDKLDEAFLYSESIDVSTYGRQRDKLREALTLAKIDHHADAVDELDVEGILAFAERILPRASDLWVQASLDYKQRLQQLFFPEGIAFDGNRFNRTAVTAPLFNYLARSESADERVVNQTGIEPTSIGVPAESRDLPRNPRRRGQIDPAALIVIDGGGEPPRGEAERSARTTCCAPRVANPSLACYQARLSRAARQARQ